MAGTISGGKAAAATNKKKYDAIYMEKYGMTFYQYLGTQGGKKGHTGGFWADRELARRAGAMGGRVSKRNKQVVDDEQSN